MTRTVQCQDARRVEPCAPQFGLITSSFTMLSIGEQWAGGGGQPQHMEISRPSNSSTIKMHLLASMKHSRHNKLRSRGQNMEIEFYVGLGNTEKHAREQTDPM